jgi:nitroreductase
VTTESELAAARQVLRTTAAARTFTDEPISDATLIDILDDARFAPSGGNRQPWHVVVVKDAGQRRHLAGLMHEVWDEYIAVAQTGRTPFTAVDAGVYELPAPASRGTVPNPLLDDIESVPAVLVVGADLASIAFMDKDLDRIPLAGGASIFPFCWSILLAARARDLGGVLTTFLSRREPAAAPLLGLPPTMALAATLFLGHPVHQPTKLRRQPVSHFATVDRFDGVPLVGGPS